MADSSSSSSAAPAKSDVEMEELLERMLTRLALCDNSKLEALLSKLLPLAISFLSTQSQAVRNKVIEILSHVNKRVKHQTEIGLPLSELWKMYNEATALMVKNFSIVYIEMAFDRENMKGKEGMGPILLANISKLSHQHQDIILRIATKVIGECHINQIDSKVGAKYRLLTDFQDRDVFLEFCLHTILFQLPAQGGACSAGLSVGQAARVTGKHPLKAETLLNRKLGILNVTGVMGLAPELVFPLYVAASADSQEPVIKRGEELLKKVASAVNLDDLRLIRRLFLLFNGTRGVENVASESIVSPGSISLRVKLMSVLCRSIAAANSFPSTLQCVFGCIYGSDSTSRLKQLGMEFTVWVFKHARIDQLQLMGPLILNGIVKSLDGSLNSEPDGISRDTKIFAFQAIGLLALRMPVFFRDKIDMAVRLFDALKSEPQSLRFIIQESTNSLANAYKDAPATVLKDVEQLLLRNSQVEQSEARSCAVRWAISLYDRHHCPSRFICMLGVADSKLDIREMALEGLFSKNEEHSISQNVDFKYPRLGDMLNYIVKQQPKLLDSGNLQDQQLLFPSNIYIVMIKFLLKCFEAELQQDNSLRSAIENPSSVQTMYLLLEHAMAFEGSVELHGTASKALMMIGAHLPEMTASRYVTRISFLKQFLGHLDHDTRDSVARLLGIASSALPTSESCALITELIISIDGRQKLRFEMLHGTLSAIGYMTAELMTRIPGIPDILMNTIHFLVDFVNSEATTLASVAMQALGHIALRVPLPPLDSVPALLALQGKLCKLLSGDDIRAIQKIVISLGHISVKETSSQLKIVLDLIFNLARSKVEDILFATGEALAFLWGGIPVTADMILKTNYTSLAMQSNFLLGDVSSSLTRYCNSNGENEADDDGHVMVRDAITEKLFNGLLYSTRKDERCAGTVWLLSLTLYCSRHPAIQKMLPDIQEAFSHLLGEQSELIQDLASQGMSIVYEIGDESMKQNLVNALVSTLTGSGKRKRAIKLVEDSEVFQEGAIGDSLGGGKLSTYKELCNLANEMGQPDLIYKFMDLANYQASMNSKRGAAFGFSKIAKQAGDALQPHLKSLVPRLVRYQYDPDKNVQDAMTHIWKSLVANSKKTIDENLDIIFDDLLIQCGSRLWRSREASCLALADIIQGRKFDQVCKHLEKIWKATFRAMDDIKETVRKAGDNLCRALTSLTIRLCDVSLTNAPDASSSMDIVLPLLLTQGILSKVDNIRVASTGIVMKLTKGAGIAIRPHLSDLVCCMLESLSSLEDQGLNYVELHAENVGIQTDKLENLRISVAKSSPMWDTLDECIKVVDAQTLDSLVPRLAQLVRSGVGLNTRVGVASFLSLLVQKVGVDVKPFTGMLLRLLFPVVKEEKSIAAKRAFANACSSVLKHASTSQAQKLIEDTTALHNGDKKCQVSCAILLKSFSSMAPDVMTGYHAAVVPVIFISRFEDDKYVSCQFEELWEETTSGERITLHLYLGEIVSLICECINSSSWANKKKSAQAIVKLCDVLDKSMSSYHHILLKSLMKELNGRLWEGKEVFLHAIGAISMSCHEAISKDDPALPNTILDVVSSACTKKDKKFREASFSCLQKVLKGFGSPMFFGMVFPLFLDMINSATLFKPVQASLATDKTKAESDDVEDLSPLGDRILSCMEACIHVAHVDDILSHRGDLVDVCLGSLSPGLRWTVKMSAFSLIKELCLALQKAMDDPQKASLHASAASLACELFHSVSPQVLETLSTVKIAQVHIAASECLLEMTKLYRALPTEYWKDIEFKDELLRHYEAEKNEQAKSLLRNCTEVLETLILEESAQSG